MKLSEIFPLLEARVNPLQNPKVSAYEALLPYKDNPNVFIHFSDYEKLGLNPLSEFATPLGIYGYPLKDIWKHYDIDDVKTFKYLPFASDRQFIIVYSWNGKGTFINDMQYHYNTTNLNNDIAKLKEMYSKKPQHDYYGDLDKLLKKYAINYDRLDIHHLEIASIIIKPNRDSPKYNQIYSEINKAKNNFYQSNIDINDVIEKATEDARGYEPISTFWNITRWIANHGDNPSEDNIHYHSKLKEFNNHESLVVSYDMSKNWNTILRKLGYAGFADRSGKGFIHGNEPIQCVLLSTQFCNKIDIIHNKDYKEPIKKSEPPKEGKVVYIGDNPYDLNNGYAISNYLKIEMKYEKPIPITQQQYDKLMKDTTWKPVILNLLKQSDYKWINQQEAS
jgi:hypothetical protein